MTPQTSTHRRRHNTRFSTLISSLLLIVGYMLSLTLASAQTLQFHYTFEDSGLTAGSGPDGALGASVPLTVLSYLGAATDYHGAAGSGVQVTGKALDFSSAVNAGNPTSSAEIDGPVAYATNNATLTSIGTITNFTYSLWFKENNLYANTQNRGGRVFVLGDNSASDSLGTTNSISVAFQSTNELYFKINNTILTPPFYINPLPTNVWKFIAVTYDGTNESVYYGTEGQPALLVAIETVGSQPVAFTNGSADLLIGNRVTDRKRGFSGWIDDVRFYTGAASASFVESIRQASTPIVVSSVYPDGLSLLEGTNTFTMAINDASGISTSGISVAVNGVDVSSSLVIGGSANSRTVSYTGLTANGTLASTQPLNASRIDFKITDQNGVVTTNSITYDTFSPTNYTWEGEDYDFNGGQFIDNPRYAFQVAADTYYQTSGIDFVDYSDNGAGAPRVYRSISDLVETEYSTGLGQNGGNSVGEMMRQKIRDAFALDNTIRDVDMGNFDGPGAASGLPNWVNYTRTYPAGNYNLYGRLAFGATAGGSTLSMVTSGFGSSPQTTTNIGTFTLANTGGWESYAWVPMRDSSGNLVRLNLTGTTNTFQLTANSGGGGNNNFFMLVPANTNVPAISGIYPNGTNQFQPAAALTFTVASPAGVSIGTNSIKLTVAYTNILGGFVTNVTATNGLVITGTATSRNVSYALAPNTYYVVTINATDANGNPANSLDSFDTYSPAYTWLREQ